MDTDERKPKGEKMINAIAGESQMGEVGQRVYRDLKE